MFSTTILHQRYLVVHISVVVNVSFFLNYNYLSKMKIHVINGSAIVLYFIFSHSTGDVFAIFHLCLNKCESPSSFMENPYKLIAFTFLRHLLSHADPV